MVSELKKYLSRKYYRRIEKRLDVKSIAGSWIFNFLSAFLIFNAALYATSDLLFSTILTLYGWGATLTVTAVYWLYWIQRKMKAERLFRICVSVCILIMFAACLIITYMGINFISGIQ